MINLETIEVNGLLAEFAYLELENSWFDGYTDEGIKKRGQKKRGQATLNTTLNK